MLTVERRTIFSHNLGQDVVDDRGMWKVMVSVLSQPRPWNTTWIVISTHIDNQCTFPGEIMHHPRLHRVYCKNAQGKFGGKLFPLPVGLKWAWTYRPELENVTRRKYLYEQYTGTPGKIWKKLREKKWHSLLKVLLPPLEECGDSCYCATDGACSQRNRSEVLRILTENFSANHADVELTIGTTYQSQNDYLETLQRFHFVVSPPGFGEDCHRTWEALMCGVVPILLRTPIVRLGLFNDLPVWSVTSYRSVHPKSLRKKAGHIAFGIKHGYFDMSKLYAPYWKSLISERSITAATTEPITASPLPLTSRTSKPGMTPITKSIPQQKGS